MQAGHLSFRSGRDGPPASLSSVVMLNPVRNAHRYICGIAACQAVLLLAWINLGPDASATGYDSVQSLLKWIGNSQPQDQAYLLLASSAIRGSSRNVHILGTLVHITSVLVIFLCTILAIQLRRNDSKIP